MSVLCSAADTTTTPTTTTTTTTTTSTSTTTTTTTTTTTNTNTSWGVVFEVGDSTFLERFDGFLRVRHSPPISKKNRAIPRILQWLQRSVSSGIHQKVPGKWHRWSRKG